MFLDVTMAVRAELSFFASVTKVLTKAQVNDLRLLAEVGKSLLRAEALEMLDNFPISPCLLQYSADCTPVRTRSHYSAGKGLTSLSHASVATTQEYLVQLCFLTVLCGDTVRQKIVFRDPICLQHGKTMPALFGCAQKFIPSQWLQGREGIVIFHQIHDRDMSRQYREAVSGLVCHAALPQQAGAGLHLGPGFAHGHLREFCVLSGHPEVKTSVSRMASPSNRPFNYYTLIPAK